MTTDNTNKPPYLVTNQSLTVIFDGDSRTVQADTPAYNTAIKCIKEMDWEALKGAMTPETQIEKESGGLFRVENGQVYVTLEDETEFAVPSGLNSTILKYMELDLDFDRLVKFAIKLADNPSHSSVQQLFDFISNTNLTITDDGDFIAYKSVNSDYTDCYSGKFDNTPGQVVKIPRRDVDEDPEVTCSHGLHVATYDYAHNVYHGAVTLYCAVNPRDVVAVPTDYNRAKIRVCEYRSLGVSEKEFTSPVYNVCESFNNKNTEDDCANCDDDCDTWCDECERNNCVCDEEDKYEDQYAYDHCEKCGDTLNNCLCDKTDDKCRCCKNDLNQCACDLEYEYNDSHYPCGR